MKYCKWQGSSSCLCSVVRRGLGAALRDLSDRVVSGSAPGVRGGGKLKRVVASGKCVLATREVLVVPRNLGAGRGAQRVAVSTGGTTLGSGSNDSVVHGHPVAITKAVAVPHTQDTRGRERDLNLAGRPIAVGAGAEVAHRAVGGRGLAAGAVRGDSGSDHDRSGEHEKGREDGLGHFVVCIGLDCE
ncbi:hypothetical protein BC828DRAFT_372225 [Blastocladiella britannica]|nr:hypothetical protein BC828DRAFT_372225 [Blastocladiella britannica]